MSFRVCMHLCSSTHMFMFREKEGEPVRPHDQKGELVACLSQRPCWSMTQIVKVYVEGTFDLPHFTGVVECGWG